MKKLLLLIAFMPIAAMADGWTTKTLPADPVLGEDAKDITYFERDGVKFVYYSNEYPDHYFLAKDDGFNCIVSGGLSGLYFKIGLYDADGNLIDNFEMWLDKRSSNCHVLATRHVGYMSQPMGQQQNTRKIFNTLQKGGTIRFALEPALYGIYDTSFDFTVDPLPDDLKPNK